MPAGDEGTRDVGLIGLAVMGANLSLNIASRGFSVAVHNQTWERAAAVMSERGQGKQFQACESLADLVRSLRRPRRIILMVQAGARVDVMIHQLTPLLQAGDILVDGGNSWFKDTIPPSRSAQPRTSGTSVWASVAAKRALCTGRSSCLAVTPTSTPRSS